MERECLNQDGDTPLHSAVCGGQLDIVQLLLDRADIDPNRENKDGDTPLHSAVCGGQLDIVQLLLDRGDIDPNRENKSGNTPLHSGVCCDHLHIVQLLLTKVEIDPNRGNKYKSTPLHLAVSGGRILIIKSILERDDTDPNKETQDGDTPLHSAVSIGHIHIIQLLLEREDTDPSKENQSGNTPLHYAVKDGRVEIVKLLLERTDIQNYKVNKDGKTPVDIATKKRRYDLYVLLLGKTATDHVTWKRTALHNVPRIRELDTVQFVPGPSNKYPFLTHGDTPLHSSVSCGDFETTKKLLENKDTDPNKINTSGNTPLHYAVKDKRVEIVKLLLKRADIQIDKRNKVGKTPVDIAFEERHYGIHFLLLERNRVYKHVHSVTLLHSAVEFGDFEMTKHLLEQTNIDTNIVDTLGNTPLHLSILLERIQIYQLLLERKDVDPNEKNKQGNTPLHLVVLVGDLKMTKMLLERTDTDLNKVNESGNTPLHLSILHNHIEISQILLERQCVYPNEKNKHGDTPSHLAVAGRNLEITQILLERTDADFNQVNEMGNTPLHLSILMEHIQVVPLLLERKDVDPDKTNQSDETPLHIAVLKGHPRIVRLLLQRKDVDPNKTYKCDETILHLAVSKGHPGIVRLLLERSDLDPNAKNKSGETSLYSAILKKDITIVKALLERKDVDVNEQNQSGETPLFAAILNRDIVTVQYLLERRDLDLNGKNMIEETPLLSAVLNRDIEIVQSLLRRADVNPNVKNKDGDTPLHSATRNGNFQMVLLLLGRTDVLTNETNMYNQTPSDVLEAQNWVSEEDKKRMRAVRDLIKFHSLGFPAELRTLDKDSAKLFTHLLEEESYPHFESRVMLAGEQGTGKTTIARYLIGKGPTRMRKSTDGISLYTGLSYIDRETDEWLDGKQDFSLAELTISRSLRQTPLGIPTNSLSTEVSNDSSNTHDSRLITGASVRFSEQLEGNKDIYKMPDGPFEREKNNIGLKEQADFNIATHSIPSKDGPPDLDTLQGDSNEKLLELKISLGLDKMQGHPQAKTPVKNVNLENKILHCHLQSETPMQKASLNLDKTKWHFKDERLVQNVFFDPDNQRKNPTNVRQDLNSEQDNQEDKPTWPKALLHIDEHLVHPLDNRPIPNVQFDSDTPERKSKDDQLVYHEEKRDNQDCRPMLDILFTKVDENEIVQDTVLYNVPGIDSQHRDNENAKKREILGSDNIYSNDDTSCKDSDDVIEALPMTVHQTNDEIFDESQAYKANLVSPLMTSSKKDSSILEKMPLNSASHSRKKELAQERIKTLHKSIEVEQATSGLNPSVESITNPGLISQLKRFFGVSKKVEEIKVSITEEHILQQSLIVGKKKLHHRHIAPVIIWDFGGQDIFYSTHQSFLSYRAIYLLVLDGSRTLDDPCQFDQYLPGKSGSKTARDYLRFWINTIVTYCKGREHGFPKIMVVFTHKDKLKPSEVETRREQLFGDVKRMFHGSALMSHLVIEDNIFVNARNKNDPEMTKIKTVIIRESKLQPTWGQNLPKCFIPLELEFEKLIRKGINVITIADLRHINTYHPIRPLTDAELKVFLKFQHAIGKILYFDEPGLDQHVTLLPTYLIDAFKSIITDKSFCKGEKQREDLWNLMSQKGVISKVAIEELWKHSKYRRFEQRKDYLLAVMTHLDILVEPRRYDTKHNRIPADFYYVASMVQAKDTTGYIQSPSFSERSIAVSFNSNDAIIPPALSFRFITYCLSIFDVKKYGDRNDEMLFHRSAVFTIDPSLDIHILCEDERIFVRLVHARKKVLIMRDLASSICDCLKTALQNISKLYIKSSSDTCEVNTGSFELNLCCSDAESPCLLPLDEFDSIGGIWICPKHKMEHERFVLSRWLKEDKTGIACDVNCPVTSEEFLSEVPSALHLRRLSILCNVDEIREMVTQLGLSYVVWSDLYQLESEPELLKFKALCLCHKKSALTFRTIKNVINELPFQAPHILCEVMKGDSVDFKTDPEKWDLVPTDEDIDKMAPLIGNKSLLFLVELGMDLEIWATINYRQMKRDLVQLNRDILDEWKTTFCTVNNIKPTLRMIAQAYKHIGNDVKVIEHNLFN